MGISGIILLFIGLRKITATSYNQGGKGEKVEYNGKSEIKTPLQGDGDFASGEVQAEIAMADWIITNPPFSLKRVFLNMCLNSGKDFVFLAPFLCHTTNLFFDNRKNRKISIIGRIKQYYIKPDKSLSEVLSCWVGSYGVFKNSAYNMLKYSFNPEGDKGGNDYDNTNIRSYSHAVISKQGLTQGDLIAVPMTIFRFYDFEDYFQVIGHSDDLYLNR